MNCKKPYMLDGRIPTGCGQCMPCRINRRRLWASRMMLESQSHEKSSFVTLTYDDEHLPISPDTGLPQLEPEDTRLWLMRLRKAIYPNRFRYYLVGEYGDTSWRPHYHLALFGLKDPEVIQKTWNKGHTMTADLTPESSNYIAGYVTKKMTHHDHPDLDGRYPEFARMSNRPGIGALSVDPILDVLTSVHGSELIEEFDDIPNEYQVGSKRVVFGRYLKNKLREAYGIPTKTTERLQLSNKISQWELWLQELQTLYAANPETPSKELIIRQNELTTKSIERRFALKNQKPRRQL